MSKKRVLFLLLSLVLLSYLNSLSNEFVWDDHRQIAENKFIRKIGAIPLIFTQGNDATFRQETGTLRYYRPLQVLSYSADYRMYGARPFGFRLTNIFWHFLNSLLVFMAVYLVSRKGLVSLWTGAIFAVHPINSSAVSYISGRADLIALFFLLSSFILWIQQGAARDIRYVFSIVLFSMAVLSKEVSLIFPAVLVCDAFIRRQKEPFAKNILKIAPFFAIVLIYSFTRIFILKDSALLHTNISFFSSLLTLSKILFSYLWLLIFPVNLYMGHDTAAVNAFLSPAESGYAVSWCVLALLAWKRRIFSKEALFFLCWSVFFLAAQLFPMHADYSRRVLMAEHWMYIPSIGIYFLIGSGFSFLMEKNRFASGWYKEYKFIFWVLCAAPILYYMALTFNQNTKWESDVTIGVHTLEKSRANRFYNWKVFANLGKAYEDLEKYPQARDYYEKALDVVLSQGEGYQYLAARLYYSIANIDCLEGKFAHALGKYKTAIRYFPFNDNFFAGLGYSYFMLNDKDNAIAALRNALGINPANINARHNLEMILKR